MPKAFISILGNTDYLECRHYYNNLTGETPVKYCQEDLIRFFCNDFSKEDEIRIYLTEDAENKNWLDNGHIDKRTGEQIPNLGLYTRLKNLNLICGINAIPIKEGFSEKEIWENFQVIYQSIKEEEEIIVDITHSFRFLPMLLITLLNYAKQIKKIKVHGIYYAAFESLGSISEVNKISPLERLVPILDLTSFSNLQDWTNVTYDFINNASVKMLNKLVRSSISNSQIQDPIQKYFPSRVVDKLNRLVDNIALCRGRELINFDYQELKEEVNQLKNRELPQAFHFLIDEVLKKISNFNNDLENLSISVADWCLKHNFIQQAITLLQEFTITLILSKIGLNISNKVNRKLVSQAFIIYSQGLPENKWMVPASENVTLVKDIIETELLKNLAPLYNRLTDIRNDVNHAGFLEDSKTVNRIKPNLEDLINSYKNYLS